MTPEQLKASVLQYAMQGKLVPQDPTDEPAFELIKRIQAEKEQLIKEKKIKKEKPLPEITDEEKHFEIPESWEWQRIGNILKVKGGKRVPKGFFLQDDPTDHIYLRVTDMKNGTIKPEKIKYADENIYKEIKNYTISSEDIYLTIAGTIGKVGSIPDNFNGALLTENAVKLENIFKINKLFMILLLNSPLVNEQFLRLLNKVAQPKLSIRSINSTIIPLPPLREQKRIVKKIEELFEKIDQYAESYNKLEELNKQFPVKMEKSLLQYAMQGKLVPQNPSDEPASELLKQIKAEKEQLIKDKKIKKEKPLSEITDEEIPFEIPESWEWIKLGEISEYIQRGKSPKYVEKSKYPVVSQKCVQWNKFTLDPARFIDENTIDKYEEYRFLRENDLLWNSTGTGTVGRINIIKREDIKQFEKLVVDSHVTIVRTFFNIDSEYILNYLKSPIIQENMHELTSGTTKQKELNLKTIVNLPIPVPPIAEQKRIVEEIKGLRNIINKI